jgi:hypothetical protein
MTTAVQHRRGTTAEHAVFTGLEGEVTIDTTKDTAVIHDGSLAGGYPLAKESLANVNPGALSAITGSATAADDVFLVYDTSATSMKKITRAELNNAIEADALASVTITGGTINGTSVGASTASSGAFTSLSASGTSTLAAVNSGALAVTGAISSTTDATLSGLTVGKGAGAIATNTAVGLSALNANTTGSFNTASGLSALRNNTTGSSNTANGAGALRNNTTGDSNTASGRDALNANTTGINNTASGKDALRDNTTGTSNTASGQTALQSNTTGYSNTATGLSALLNNTTGYSNTATGRSALLSNTTGTGNTASGRDALYSNTTGNSNTASGDNALLSNTTGSGNTAINPRNSAGAYAPVFNPTTENNRFCMGSTGVTNAYIQVAWTVVSDARDKINFAPVPHGLEFVKALQPTAYQFRTARDSEETNGGVRYGFKAQDVLALEGENPVIVDNEDADKLRMVDTALIPVLVKALQELNAKFDAYVLTHP